VKCAVYFEVFWRELNIINEVFLLKHTLYKACKIKRTKSYSDRT